MPVRACRAACGSCTTRHKAAGCCSRRSAFSRPTRSRPRSSSAAAARRPLPRSSTISPGRLPRRASGSRPMPARSCAGSPTRSSWSCDVAGNGAALPRPLGLLAELTHRCPLGCPYCSNPLALDRREHELDAATWARVFTEAAALGVLQVHLSGGEPASRRDLVEIMSSARAAGLYTNLITSGVGVTKERLASLADAGLDHVQVSIQDSEEKSADHIAGYDGAFARKRALA